MNDRHPGDGVLEDVLRQIRPLYNAPGDRTRERLEAFLRPRASGLRHRKNESLADYRARLLQAFSGPHWLLLRRMIAADYTGANEKATEHINAGLEAAFAAGFNESAYVMALSGTNMWPITVLAVAKLVAAGVISLKKRKLKRAKDIAYNSGRVQSAILAAIMAGVALEKLSGSVAETMSSARMRETTAYARAAIYGASDSGAYCAGLEAEQSGAEIEKTWLAIMDMRVRPSHSHLHGTTIPLHEKFHGYYGVLRYPHDPEAPPQEIYRCRCRMAVHLAGKSPGEYSRRLLPTETAAYQRWRDRQIRKAGGEVELAKLHERRLKGA